MVFGSKITRQYFVRYDDQNCPTIHRLKNTDLNDLMRCYAEVC